MAVPVVHWVGPRCKWLAGLPAVRGRACVISIYHIGGNGKDRGGGNAAAVGVVSLYIAHEGVYQVCCQLVYPVIVISIFREVSLHNIVGHNALFIADNPDPGILNGGQGVCHNGKACDAGCEPAGHLLVMERHLKPFIAVFIVIVVDDVQGIDIYLGQPLHHIFVFVHYIVKIQIFRGYGAVLGAYLLAADFIHPAVDGVEQALGQVGPGAEELHFLADAHAGYTAGNGIIIAMGYPHQIIVLILDGGGLNGSLGTEPLKVLRKLCGPEYGQVRLRGSAQVLKGVQITEGHLGHHVASVDSDTSDGFRNPCGVPGEQLVVFRRPGKFYKTQLHNKVVYKFLNLFLRITSFRKVALSVDIQKGGGASQGHGGAVLLLDSSQVAQVGPLYGLLHIGSRL